MLQNFSLKIFQSKTRIFMLTLLALLKSFVLFGSCLPGPVVINPLLTHHLSPEKQQQEQQQSSSKSSSRSSSSIRNFSTKRSLLKTLGVAYNLTNFKKANIHYLFVFKESSNEKMNNISLYCIK
jgi:hypothetical protein